MTKRNLKKAPSFCLKNQDGDKRCLKDLLGELEEGGFLLLYFYPKDNTPGCTKEALGFSNLKRKLKNQGVKVIGVSKLDYESKKRFAQKHNLKIELLADEDSKVAGKYGVLKVKNLYGRKVMGISRESFLIDKSGKIIKNWDKVKAATHPQEVLDFVKSLRNEGA